jgi:hypothetical protein
MTMENSFVSMFPSSFGFNNNHQEFNEDGTTTTTTTTMSSSNSLDNKNFQSMIIIDHQQNTKINQDQDEFHRKLFFIHYFIRHNFYVYFSFIIQKELDVRNLTSFF